MEKIVIRLGNSMGLYITKKDAELLNVGVGDVVSVKVRRRRKGFKERRGD